MEKQNLPSVQEVFAWMRKLYDESYAGLTPLEKKEQHMYGTMVTTPSDKKFIVRMLDLEVHFRQGTVGLSFLDSRDFPLG